jgi:hypothetical protein
MSARGVPFALSQWSQDGQNALFSCVALEYVFELSAAWSPGRPARLLAWTRTETDSIRASEQVTSSRSWFSSSWCHKLHACKPCGSDLCFCWIVNRCHIGRIHQWSGACTILSCLRRLPLVANHHQQRCSYHCSRDLDHDHVPRTLPNVPSLYKPMPPSASTLPTSRTSKLHHQSHECSSRVISDLG